MDLIETILVALVTSGAVSGGIVAIAKTWIESRVRLEHDKKLAQLEAELRKETDERLERLKDELRRSTEEELAGVQAKQDRMTNEARELLQIRLQTFPKLAELVYRLRNTARDLQGVDKVTEEALSDFRKMVKEFEETLYKYRFPLEQAAIFSKAHGYKNLLKAFVLNLKGLVLDSRLPDEESIDESKKQLATSYEDIDEAHHGIVAELAMLAFAETSPTTSSASTSSGVSEQ